MPILEVCVDDVAGLDAAIEGGADRIELCSALALGGLSPSSGLMAEAGRRTIPVIALIRPRSGGFVYSAAEERVMLQDIARAADLGLAGVAIGALRPEDGTLDLALLGRLAGAAGGLQLTLHRAFDLVPDPALALEQAVDLGFRRVLSSGGAPTAPAGSARLASLVAQSRGRLQMLAGSGITPANAPALLDASGVQELHASCRGPAADAEPMSARLLAFGFASPACRPTSATAVRALKACLLQWQEQGRQQAPGPV